MRLPSCAALALSLFALAGASAAEPADDGQHKSPLVVVLDPGHGGLPPHEGAHGPKGILEKTVVLQVAQRLKALLEEAGATVLLTREDDTDVSLADRARLANEASADLFVSIHCNSMATPRDRAITKGAETYFLSPDPTDAEAKMLAELENGGPDAVPLPKTSDAVSGLLADLALGQARNDSAMLAQALHRMLVQRTGTQSRGVRQAPFLVLSGTKMPSALVEIGFISHPQEGRQLAKEKHQQRIAQALAAGVQEFARTVLSRRLFPPTPEERAALAEQRAQAAARLARARASLSAPPAVKPEAPAPVAVPTPVPTPPAPALPTPTPAEPGQDPKAALPAPEESPHAAPTGPPAGTSAAERDATPPVAGSPQAR